ncbi:hypothetical protein [Arundinibacter roseus]|uniref:Uncharacterized protein n=1 Tax=Arundinibacter roseus TaxID=2070510 RepID=A0A4R4KGC9_9BACT|nr:hypothetical protein [Arundinibacter roseus]TDB67097.1 hypothetical protein EZE20_08260 [Arundinibacter roseus]
MATKRRFFIIGRICKNPVNSLQSRLINELEDLSKLMTDDLDKFIDQVQELVETGNRELPRCRKEKVYTHDHFFHGGEGNYIDSIKIGLFYSFEINIVRMISVNEGLYGAITN